MFSHIQAASRRLYSRVCPPSLLTVLLSRCSRLCVSYFGSSFWCSGLPRPYCSSRPYLHLVRAQYLFQVASLLIMRFWPLRLVGPSQQEYFSGCSIYSVGNVSAGSS